MARRSTKNRTNIKRIAKIPIHDAWVSFECIRCNTINFLHIGKKLLTPQEAYETQNWVCSKCKFVHNKSAGLPPRGPRGKSLQFQDWGKDVMKSGSLASQRFWKAFFTIATEKKDAYWKQCNTCGRVLPASAFSGHKGWGPLEKQMECRSCKAVINTRLNPKRTREQLHESSVRRRIADLFLKGENERIDFDDLFKRFGGRCFKTGKKLDINDRKSWAVDHVLPSRYLYPLTKRNAALLSREANDNKHDRWPSEFYSNNELKNLARTIEADLSLISKKEPVINTDIDVDKCVTRMLTVRSATDLSRRINELKKLLVDYNLVNKLSAQNKRLLGFR